MSCFEICGISRFVSWKIATINTILLSKGGSKVVNQVKIGAFLKELRKEKGLTQEELGEHFNVSSRTISRWETGSNMPDISLLIELAELYEVSIPEIIQGERKSEEMKEDVKETAMSLSDYADAINEKIRRKAVWLSVTALIGMIIFAVMNILGLDKPDSMGELIASMGLGWCFGVLIIMPFALSGRLGRLKAKIKMHRATQKFSDDADY